jgi:hypothetical protein
MAFYISRTRDQCSLNHYKIGITKRWIKERRNCTQTTNKWYRRLTSSIHKITFYNSSLWCSALYNSRFCLTLNFRWAVNTSVSNNGACNNGDLHSTIRCRIYSPISKRSVSRKASKYIVILYLVTFCSVYLRSVKEYTHLMWH